VNSEVLNPIPIASEPTATTVNAGLRRSQRRANRTSEMTFVNTEDLSV